MRIVKLKLLTSRVNDHTSIDISNAPAFALLKMKEDDTFLELNYPSLCRDFVGPACVCAHKKVRNIFSNMILEEDLLTDTNQTSISISINPDGMNHLLNNIRILHEFEQHLGIKLTEVCSTNELDRFGRAHLVIIGDKFWIKAPLAISFYTFFLRCLTYFEYHKNIGTIESAFKYLSSKGSDNVDSNYAKKIISNIDVRLLFGNLDRVLGDNPFTGLNDKVILKDTSWIEDKTKSYPDILEGVYKSSYFNNKYQFRMSSLYSQSGLVTFSDCLFLVHQERQHYIGVSNLGLDWVSNYIDLAVENKVLTLKRNPTNGLQSFEAN